MIINPFAFGVAAASDPNFANVSLLLHANGSGTSFTDSSSVGHTVTANGAATQVATPAKFGAGSASLNGNSSTGSWLPIASHSSLTFGSGDFTIEGWCRFSSTTGGGASGGTSRHVIFATDATGLAEYSLRLNVEKDDDPGHAPLFGTLSATAIYADGSSDGPISTTVHTLSVDTWYYIAMTRSGSTFEVRLNGSVHLTWTNSKALRDRGGSFIVGATGGGWEGIKGYIDDFRVTKGVARDISSQPTVEFADS